MMNDKNNFPKAQDAVEVRERLEALLLEGLGSGDVIPVTPEFWNQLWERVDARKAEKNDGG